MRRMATGIASCAGQESIRRQLAGALSAVREERAMADASGMDRLSLGASAVGK